MSAAGRVVLAIAILIVAVPPLTAASIEATLVIPDAKILPGVPFDLWIEVQNQSDRMQHVRLCEPLRMRLVAGEPIHWIEQPEERTAYGREIYWNGIGDVVVPPRERRALAIPASRGLIAGGFFRERGLSAPGRRFAISLPLCVQDERTSTTEAMLEVLTPTGADAAVWDLLQKARTPWTAADSGAPESRPLWEKVFKDHPDSNYVPYAILFSGQFHTNDWRDLLAQQLLAIGRFPDSPALEWLQVEAWRTAGALRLHGVRLALGQTLRQSKRPTTQQLVARTR